MSIIVLQLDLDTKLASMQNKLLVYFFKKELDSQLKNELKTEIWVYIINDQGKLILIPNQPFKTKCEVIRVLGIHLTTLNNHLNIFKLYKNLLFFYFFSTLMLKIFNKKLNLYPLLCSR